MENINNHPEVISAIANGNKVAAIKILRKNSGLSLKESKILIEAYMDENGLTKQSNENTNSNISWFFIIILVALGFYIYKNYI